MAPPSAGLPVARPREIATPEIVTEAEIAGTLKTRLTSLPLIVNWSEPGPAMVRLRLITNSPVLSAIVAGSMPGLKVMDPPSETSRMAWRNEPGPSSSAFVTITSPNGAHDTRRDTARNAATTGERPNPKMLFSTARLLAHSRG
jgi:hypothetical protein